MSILHAHNITNDLWIKCERSEQWQVSHSAHQNCTDFCSKCCNLCYMTRYMMMMTMMMMMMTTTTTTINAIGSVAVGLKDQLARTPMKVVRTNYREAFLDRTVP